MVPITSSVETSSRGAVILDESDPRTVIERLPNTVFPVMIRFALQKSTSGDRTHESLRTPDYPVDVRIPQGAYIPQSTVYFDNPAERPPRNAAAWRPREFVDSLSELLDEIEDSPHVDPDRLQFTDLCVAEIAPRYTTSDPQTGDTVATPELYGDQGDITLGYFRREEASLRPKFGIPSILRCQVKRDRLHSSSRSRKRRLNRLGQVERHSNQRDDTSTSQRMKLSG